MKRLKRVLQVSLVCLPLAIGSSALGQRPDREGGGDSPRGDRPGFRGGEGRGFRGGPGDRPGMGPGRGGPPESFMMRALPVLNTLDADNDGTLSSSEIAAASDALKKLDKNSDGKLSPEEMRPDFPARGGPVGRFGPGGFGDRRGPGPFGRGDRPRDGGERLSADQLTQSLRAMVMRADTNRDGFISGDEMIAAFRSAAENREERGEAEDRRPPQREGDSRPGRGPEEAQRGQPSRRGMGGPPDPEFAARMFEMRDRDGDGKLQGEEIPETISERLSGRMEQVDTDGDGAISKQELEQMFARMREGFSGAAPAGAARPKGLDDPAAICLDDRSPKNRQPAPSSTQRTDSATTVAPAVPGGRERSD